MWNDKHEDYPHRPLPRFWPRDFAKRRKFDKNAENQSFLQWLQDDFYDGDYSEKNDDNEDGEEDPEDQNEEDSDIDDSSNDEDEDDDDRIDKKDIEAFNRYNNVKAFMKGMTGDEEKLKYRDQVQLVANFCKPPSSDLNPEVMGKKIQALSLLDDRNMHGTIVQIKGDCRPYRGPLTSKQLRLQLSIPRFIFHGERKVPSNAFEEGEGDAERRIIFTSDPDSSSIEALATTVPRSHAPALKDFFYNYLAGKTSLGATIKSQGFRTFTFDFQIPHYVLRASKDLKDHRMKSDGRPLRQSRRLPLLPLPMTLLPSTQKLGKDYSLYESQISIVVTGIDDFVWTAYGFTDTYFGTKKSAYHYDKMPGRPGRPDLLAAGQINADQPIWTPREYFVRVMEIRINQVQREWNSICDWVDDAVKQSRTNRVFPLPSSDLKARQQLQDFIIWNDQMVEFLRLWIRCLADTVGAWEKFNQTQRGYFLDDGESGISSLCLKYTLDTIEMAFRDLKGLKVKLQGFEKELHQDYPQGLHARLTLENNESANCQRRTASHVEVLTVITIVFYPLALATSLFSTTGVLPFTPNLPKFIYALFIIGAILVFTLLLCFNWATWFRPVLKRWMAELNIETPQIEIDDKPVEEDLRNTTKSQPSVKRGFLPKRLRNPDFRARRDIEEGTDNGKTDPARPRPATV